MKDNIYPFLQDKENDKANELIINDIIEECKAKVADIFNDNAKFLEFSNDAGDLGAGGWDEDKSVVGWRLFEEDGLLTVSHSRYCEEGDLLFYIEGSAPTLLLNDVFTRRGLEPEEADEDMYADCVKEARLMMKEHEIVGFKHDKVPFSGFSEELRYALENILSEDLEEAV